MPGRREVRRLRIRPWPLRFDDWKYDYAMAPNSCSDPSEREHTPMAKLAHHVFFKLVNRSDEAIESLVAACNKYLDNHDGLVGFSVGTRDRELNRDVNQDFDVSLHCIFQDRPAHDAYQTAQRHLEFIEENKANWAEVRVFDSTIV